jgi:hypothetical protein
VSGTFLVKVPLVAQILAMVSRDTRKSSLCQKNVPDTVEAATNLDKSKVSDPMRLFTFVMSAFSRLAMSSGSCQTLWLIAFFAEAPHRSNDLANRHLLSSGS